MFIVHANTFDNVKGKFPIGFKIWDTKIPEMFEEIETDIYSEDNFVGTKKITSYDKEKGKINNWLKKYKIIISNAFGVLMADAPDFQSNNYISILNNAGKRHGIYFLINEQNLKVATVYLAVRQVIDATWLNDRDQFLYPNDGWQTDTEFQNDCLTFTLFHSQNRITSTEGTNHWIPFTEQEVNAQDRFESHFMTDFINGKIKNEREGNLFGNATTLSTKSEFSEEATAVFDAGRELWKYYHSKPFVNINASFYDIREYFQGRNNKGRMNNRSDDATYMGLIEELRNKLDFLADKIKPKIYEYGFLKE